MPYHVARAIEREYSANAAKTIVSPGKFEGEPRYSVFYWDEALQGNADSELFQADGATGYAFHVCDNDERLFPELSAHMDCWIVLTESDMGFVSSAIFTDDDYQKLADELEREFEVTDRGDCDTE